VSYAPTRAAALGAALRTMAQRPLSLVVITGSSALVLGLLAFATLVAWRVSTLDTPGWMRPQALVLVGGAEGETDLAAVGTALRKIDLVAQADFIGRAAALAQLAQRKSLASAGLAELRPNPLPDAFVVHFVPGAAPEAIEATVAQLRHVKNVESVEYASDTYRKAHLLARVGTRAARLLVLALGAAALIGTALAAVLWPRWEREQIQVLDLLGADPAALRRPRVYAGALTLLVAAALASWLFLALDAWLAPDLQDLAQAYALAWPPNPLPPWSVPLACAIAALLGGLIAAIGARVALRRTRSELRPGDTA